MKKWLRKHKSDIEFLIFSFIYYLALPIVAYLSVSNKYGFDIWNEHKFVLDVISAAYVCIGWGLHCVLFDCLTLKEKVRDLEIEVAVLKGELPF